jgi:hypothetical protein
VPTSHSHLGLQLSKFFLLVILHGNGRFAFDWRAVSIWSHK